MSLAVDNIAAKLFLRMLACIRGFQVDVYGVTLSGFQLGRVCERCDDSLQVENEVDGLAATIDRR